jgi:1,4-dihydroxy-2-naphthoyl-CoA hydrolase
MPRSIRCRAMSIELPYRPTHGFEALLGLEFSEVSDERMRGRVVVSDQLKQPAGLIHGGVYAAVAESLASWGTGLGVFADGKVAMGLSNQTSFLRPITQGTIDAIATRKHRGRTTWVWEVEMFDDQQRLCVLTRVTIAVREAPPGAIPAHWRERLAGG